MTNEPISDSLVTSLPGHPEAHVTDDYDFVHVNWETTPLNNYVTTLESHMITGQSARGMSPDNDRIHPLVPHPLAIEEELVEEFLDPQSRATSS